MSLLFAACAAASESELSSRVERLDQEVAALLEEDHHADAVPLAEALVAYSQGLFGVDDIETAHRQNILGYLLTKTGTAQRAVAHHEDALRIIEQESGGTEPALLQTTELLGFAWWRSERPELAVPHLRRAVDLAVAIYGDAHPETARLSGDLGRVLDASGDVAGAQRAFERALRIVEALDAQHPDRSRYLSGLGSAFKAQGEYQQARTFFELALEATEQVHGSDHPEIATDHNNLATVLELLGMMKDAERHHERALALYRRHFGDRHPSTANSLSNLGAVRESLGDFASAKALYEEALAIREERLGADHPSTLITLTNLGHLLKATGDLRGSEHLYQRVLDVRREKLGAKHPKTATSLNNLAAVVEARGDLAQARKLQEQALAIRRETLGDNHPATAISLNNLGLLVAAMGQPTMALELLTEALAIREEVYPPGHPEIATNIANLGSLFRFAGDLENVQIYFQRALDMRLRSLGREHPSTARSHHNVGMVLLQLGDLAGSRSHFEESAAIREVILGADHPDTDTSLLSLAGVEQAAGNLERALALTRRVTESHERWLARHLETGTDAERRLLLRTQRGLAHWTVALHLRSAPSSSEAARLALTSILRDKGRALEAALGSERQQLQESQEQQILIEPVQKALAPEAALVELFVFERFDARVKPNPWGEPHYAAYVLRRSGEPAAVDLGPIEVIDTAVTAFRKALAGQSPDVGSSARELDALTLEKIRPLLADATRLVVSPDGDLNLVPFAALVDPAGSYLIERYRLSYVTSGRDLLDQAPARKSREPPLIVGGPDFEAVPASWRHATAPGTAETESTHPLPPRFDPLAGAAAEASAVGKLLGLEPERILTGASATEAAIKAVRGPRILHLATHGFFLPDLPFTAPAEAEFDVLHERARETRDDALLRSGLALAGFNRRREAQSDDDGVLTALEVMGLDLRGTEVVTLSACETGVGEVRSGQGVFGLRRALALAGARSQMTSLWQVEDEPTRQLMTSWYAQLEAGISGAEALRRAQLAALQGESLPATREPLVRGVRPRPTGAGSPPEGSRHPYYWASFIFVGPTGPE